MDFFLGVQLHFTINLIIFSKELDDYFEWTEQDIYEQSRKIIFRWDNA